MPGAIINVQSSWSSGMGALGVWKRIARRATTMNYINQDKTAIISGVWEFSRTTLVVSSIDRAYILK